MFFIIVVSSVFIALITLLVIASFCIKFFFPKCELSYKGGGDGPEGTVVIDTIYMNYPKSSKKPSREVSLEQETQQLRFSLVLILGSFTCALVY